MTGDEGGEALRLLQVHVVEDAHSAAAGLRQRLRTVRVCEVCVRACVHVWQNQCAKGPSLYSSSGPRARMAGTHK